MNLRNASARLAIVCAAAVIAAVAAIFAAIQGAAEDHLRVEAEQSALKWAEVIRDTVPDLDPLFRQAQVSPAGVRQLGELLRVNEIFRFKLYDKQGKPILVSDDIVRDADGSVRLAARPPAVDNEEVHQVVLQGHNQIELHRSGDVTRPPVYSEAYVPVISNGQVIGVVEVYVDQTARARRITNAFRRIALGVAAVFVLLMGVAAWQLRLRRHEQKQVEARVRYMAHHDTLTGVLNRASFNAALADAEQRARDSTEIFAVLCIDLDRFKEVNDALGHAAGDETLCAVARRLQAVVRQFDQVARLGGDEFAILQTGVRRVEDVTTLAQRVVEALAPPHEIAGQRVMGGASVGAAVYGTDGTDSSQLLHKADLALYRAKSNGRGQYSFYDAQTDETLQSRRAMIRDLRDALKTDGLSLNFQPLFDADGTTLTGYEALARWTHPKHGAVSPMVFIPLAEEAGLIEELGAWVLNRACLEAATWPATVDLSVNLSAAQFRSDLVGTVKECLAASGLPASRLHLEITESLLINNTDAVLRTLHGLTGLGVRIAMDDFGTGYSSLAYLWRFPFDKLKIDRAFTQNLEQDPKVDLIVKSIISLAHSMGIRVNAEGVETPQQLARLQSHGCDELQGYLLGRPSAASQLDHAHARHDAPPPVAPRATNFGSFDTIPGSL
jgi:diguanylate cyclase (GGDEF)-like protein